MRFFVPNKNVGRHITEKLVGQGEYVPSPLFNSVLRVTRSSPYLDRNDRHESIFVHVPRTGGTSIANALFEDGDRGHAPLYAYRAFDAERYRAYFKFAFVRNPYSRFVSSFHQVRDGAHNPKVQRWAEHYLSDITGFGEFVERMGNNSLFRRVVLALDHFRPQWEFVTVGGNVEVDFLGKFERIEEYFRKVREELEISASLPKKNTSSHGHYTNHYTEGSRRIVKRIYTRDFRVLGYDTSLSLE